MKLRCQKVNHFNFFLQGFLKKKLFMRKSTTLVECKALINNPTVLHSCWKYLSQGGHMCTFIVMRSWDHIGGHIKNIIHYKQFSLLLCDSDLWCVTFFLQSIAAVTKVTCINIVCCILCNCNTLCENMSSCLLNTCVVSSIVEHVMFPNRFTTLWGSVWNYMFGILEP